MEIHPTPFIKREDFAWGDGAVISLQLRTIADQNYDILIVGGTKNGSFRFFTVVTAGSNTISFNMTDIPTFVSVTSNFNSSPFFGDVFAILSLQVNGDNVLKMCEGYVVDGNGPSWPMVQNGNALLGTTEVVANSSADPAAGAQATFTIATKQSIIIQSMDIVLVTDATVASRYMQIQIGDAVTATRIQLESTKAQTASQTRQYSFANYGFDPAASQGTAIMVPMPPGIIVGQGEIIKTNVINLQAGDNMGVLYVRGQQIRLPY